MKTILLGKNKICLPSQGMLLSPSRSSHCLQCQGKPWTIMRPPRAHCKPAHDVINGDKYSGPKNGTSTTPNLWSCWSATPLGRRLSQTPTSPAPPPKWRFIYFPTPWPPFGRLDSKGVFFWLLGGCKMGQKYKKNGVKFGLAAGWNPLLVGTGPDCGSKKNQNCKNAHAKHRLFWPKICPGQPFSDPANPWPPCQVKKACQGIALHAPLNTEILKSASTSIRSQCAAPHLMGTFQLTFWSIKILMVLYFNVSGVIKMVKVIFTS